MTYRLEEARESQAVALLSNGIATSSIFTTQTEQTEPSVYLSGCSTPPMTGHVNALRSRWEQEASKMVKEDPRRQVPIDKNGKV